MTEQELENMRISFERSDAMLKRRDDFFNENLPSWQEVSVAVGSIGNLADAKAFIMKLSRIVYWLAKNTED